MSRIEPVQSYVAAEGEDPDQLVLVLSLSLVGAEGLVGGGNRLLSGSIPAEESDCLTEYEEDGMDTVREEEGEEEEEEEEGEEGEEVEDQSPGEWSHNGLFQTVRHEACCLNCSLLWSSLSLDLQVLVLLLPPSSW